MAIKHAINCPNCGKSLNVTSEMAGRSGKCNACGNRFVITLPKAVDEPTPIGDLTPVDDEGFGLQPLDRPPAVQVAPLKPLPAAASATAAKHPGVASKPTAAAPNTPKNPSPLPIVALLIGGGAVALLLCGGLVAVAAYMFTGSADPVVAEGGPTQAANAGGAAGHAPAVVVEDPATIQREPKVGPNSWVPAHPLAAADPATWKVTVEKFPPLPKEALTVIPLPKQKNEELAIHFTTPDVAKFAVVSIVSGENKKGESIYPITWNQHSLLEPKPVKVVTIDDQTHSPHATNLMTALSPQGDLLAYVHEREPSTIYLWKEDGSSGGRVEIPEATSENKISQFWLSDSRVLVLAKDWLKGYDLASGNEVYALPERPRFPPALARGNKFFAVPWADRISFYQTADGSPAGEILLGEHWSAKDLEAKDRKQQATAVSFHPQGELLATLSRGPSGDVLIAKWDLAQGKPLEQCLIPARDLLVQSFWLESIWMGERRLLLSSGDLFDFDKHTWIHHYGLDSEYRHLEGPDARWWRMGPYVANRVKEHFGITDRDTVFLTASTVPSKKWEAAMASAKLSWHPGFRMSLETAAEVPPEERAQLISAVADAIAERGYAIDPQAKHKMKILAWVKAEPNLARALGSPNAPKDRVYGGSMMLELVDQQGERLMILPDHTYRIAVTTEGMHNCWVALGQEAKKSLQLPRFARYDELYKGARFEPLNDDQPMIDGFEVN